MENERLSQRQSIHAEMYLFLDDLIPMADRLNEAKVNKKEKVQLQRLNEQEDVNMEIIYDATIRKIWNGALKALAREAIKEGYSEVLIDNT